MRPLLASSSADGTVRLWNLNGLKTAGGDDHKQLIEMDSSALTLRLSGGGKARGGTF